jgi:hypothetical protein
LFLTEFYFTWYIHKNRIDPFDLFAGAIIGLQERGELVKLRSNFIEAEGGNCQVQASDVNADIVSITFKDLYGGKRMSFFLVFAF